VTNQLDMLRTFTFLLDGTLYAVRLGTVVRLVPAAALTPLPGAPSIVLGLLDLEGGIVPVVDIRARFRLLCREMGVDDCIIIASTARKTLGILVHVPILIAAASSDLPPFRLESIAMGAAYFFYKQMGQGAPSKAHINDTKTLRTKGAIA
jgi:hypothetical protein